MQCSNVEEYEHRPAEEHFHDRMGGLQYKPHRGDSFLDVHTRTGLFVVQQRFFETHSFNIIVSHAAVCLMLHYFLIAQCPKEHALQLKAHDYWPNTLVRAYSLASPQSQFEYLGTLNGRDAI